MSISIETINKHKHLYFENLIEPEENELAFSILEAIPDDVEEDIQIGETVISGSRAIITNDRTAKYTVCFGSYVANGTFATADYPGPFKHYGVICLNHVIHVASELPPEITKVKNTQR